MQKRIAVLGAGPGGLALAQRLSAFSNVEVDLIERSDRVGGLHHSINIDGAHYDIGTFLFHDGHEMLETFPSVKDLFVPIEYRPASITPRGGYDSYPFSIRGYLRDNGPFVLGLSAVDILWSKLRYFRQDSVPAYACYYTGSLIYHRSGLQNYVCRLHDTADEEIDVTFAQRRMHVLGRNSLRKLAMKALSSPYRKKATAQFRRRLVRPREGMPYLYDLIRKEVESRDVNIRTNCEVRSVRRTDDKYELAFADGCDTYDRVISTIPMPTMARLIGRTPETNIENRDLVSLFFRGKFKHDAPAFFNFTYKGLWKRITVFSKFYGPHRGGDFFTVEVTTQDTSLEHVETLRRDFEDHAREFSLLEGTPEFVGSCITERAYPIYRRGQMDAIEKEKRALKGFGIDLVGRQGNFEYIISDVVAQRARTLVDEMSAQMQLSQAPDVPAHTI